VRRADVLVAAMLLLLLLLLLEVLRLPRRETQA
jgi:hypothetical protein